jgi:cytidylate kinase
MSIITVSRGSLSGGKALAEGVAGKLGYRCISSEVIVEAARKYGVPEPDLTRVFDKSPTFWERFTESKRIYLTFIQGTLCEQALQGNMVYHGNAGQELLREVPHVLHVRLIAPLEFRIRFGQEQNPQLDRKALIKQIQEVDEERTRRMHYFFNVDWRDPLHYDLVIDLSKLSIESAVDVVIEAAQGKEFQSTPDSLKILQDLAVRCHVIGALAVHPKTKNLRVEVAVDNGVVQLRSAVPAAMKETVQTVIREVAGVKEVIA